MFTKEKNIIKEKMDKKLIQKEKISAKINRQNILYNNAYSVINKYNSFKSAKRFLGKLIKFLACWCVGVFVSCFILPHDLFFPMQETEELMNFLYFTISPSLVLSYFCIDQIRIIIKTKSIKEDDYNRSLQDVKESEKELTKLKNKNCSLTNEIKKCENTLKYIDELQNNINNILSLSDNQQHVIYTDDFIKEKLLEDFEEYLNESVDYSKVSLDPEIKSEDVVVKKLSIKR